MTAMHNGIHLFVLLIVCVTPIDSVQKYMTLYIVYTCTCTCTCIDMYMYDCVHIIMPNGIHV